MDSLSLALPAASPSALAAALAIDLLLGELPSRVHPVVWMGTSIRWAERALPQRGALRQLIGGGLLALLLPLGCALLSWLLLGLLSPWPFVAWLAHVVLLTAMFAGRALGEAAHRVRDALGASQLGAARQALRSLCSRDPSQLSEADLIGASIESVAENASDSFVAPLFYYVLLGLPGAVLYRAVNTLDSMLGYRGHYEYLGKASARLDDALNFIPARITAALLLIAGLLARANVRRAVGTWRRDAASTPSPNAGRPMATMAGLLGVRLEKSGHYQLGDACDPLVPRKIEAAWHIVQLAGAVAALLALSVLVYRSH